MPDLRISHKLPYPCPVISTHEFLFLPHRGLIRVPEEFECFHHSDFFWGFLDQGYKSRYYRHWVFWKLVRPDWFQEYHNWGLCRDTPHYCLALLEENNFSPLDGRAVIEGTEPIYCYTVWIRDRSTLRYFFEAFPFTLFPKDSNEVDNYDVAENLLILANLHAKDPSAVDYLYRFWPDLSVEEQQRFLTEMANQNSGAPLFDGIDRKKLV